MSTPSQSLGEMSVVKLALLAKQARAQLGVLARAEPIAVVGMGCRLPGGVDSPEGFWDVLRHGVDTIGDIPPHRWDVAAFHDADASAPGKSSVTQGGFLMDEALFDAGFFGIIRREAEKMDPQQRIFLEVAIEALDHAGLARERLAGSDTGVFVASYYNDYAAMQFADREVIDARTLTGTLHSVLANRLSYLLDLRGPSVSVDTACSSSLVAVHLACQSLRSGETRVALAGGVSLMLSPEMMIALDKVGFMSPSGRCRTFSADADGFARGEGCGVVVLKRLSDAITDRDRILSVIRSSSVNQDGHSTVLAAPNGLAQEALVRDALHNAQLTPDRVGYVETHGTATPLGDPIEVEALAAVLGAIRPDGSLCYLGSAKANLGHLEAAAGVAGLIKTTLMLQHREIPRQPHFTSLNPQISLAGTSLAIADRHRPWLSGGSPRIAGVSGFGVGGTNAHVLLEEAPALGSGAAEPDEPLCLLPLSAESAAALRALVERWVAFLETDEGAFGLRCATAACRRSHYAHRLAVVAETAAEASAALRRWLDGEASPVVQGRPALADSARVAFVFSGQGSQWVGMGRDLSSREPVFHDTLVELDARFQALAGWSLLEQLAAPEETSRIMETEVAQPVLFAIQVALAALWRSWGVVPDAVVGHSIGELAALHVAGMLSLDDAVRIVHHRGRLMQRATGNGRMVAAGISAAEAATLVEDIGADLSLAAVNAPRSVVLAGTESAVARAVGVLQSRGVDVRVLPVYYAFHSAQMAPFEAELVSAIGSVRAQPGAIAVYSTVTGARLAPRQVDAAYFGRNLVQSVRFADAMGAVIDAGMDCIVELAPHAVLAGAIAECSGARGREVLVLASMRRGRGDRESMRRACAGVYVTGRTPDWDAVMPLREPPVDLPPYPWQRERYWLRAFDRHATHAAPLAAGLPALLGEREGERAEAVASFVVRGGDPSLAWLADHHVGGQVILPGAAMLEVLRMAAGAVVPGRRVSLHGFTISEPLLLRNADARDERWRTLVRRDGADLTVSLHEPRSADGGEGRIIASARAVMSSAPAVVARNNHSDPPESLVDVPWDRDAETLYARFAALGMPFGPAFRVVDSWRLGRDAAEGWLVRRTEHAAGTDRHTVHPTLLDGVLQLCVTAMSTNDGHLPGSLRLPLGVDAFAVHASVPDRVRVLVHVDRDEQTGAPSASAMVLDADDHVVATLDGARFAPVDADALARLSRSEDVYAVAWGRVSPSRPATPLSAAGRWIVLAHDAPLGTSLLQALASAGGRCEVMRLGGATTGADRAWTVSQADSAALGAALAALISRSDVPVRGIVHAWGCEGGDASEDREAADWRVTGSALATVQALTQHQLEVPLVLVTQGAQSALGTVRNPAQAGLWGLASVVVLEHPELSCRVIDVADGDEPAIADALVQELVRGDDSVPRVALRGTERFAPRLERYRTGVSSHAVPRESRLVAPVSGDLDDLRWESAAPRPPAPTDVRLRVLVCGLNFRDVLLALGMYPGNDAVLGAECVGEVEAVGSAVHDLHVGDRVFGLTPRSLATSVTVPRAFVAPVPDGVTLEQAASLPIAFLTAMFGFQQVASVGPGTRVLVHAAAGGVGLAAVQLAQRAGAEVFATAGSDEKRAYLRALGVQHVFDSRSIDFADDVLAATDGRGVHVVLNSLAGAFIEASVRALATGGWLLELGKRDVWTPERLAAVRPDARYRVYDLGAEAEAEPALVGALLRELTTGLADGSLRPLPIKAFPFREVTRAFRFMAQARHTGKLVLRAPGVDAGRLPIVKRDATSLITGGAGAVGVRTARWLVTCGARSIVLVSRGAPGADSQRIIGAMREAGASVLVRAADVSDRSAMHQLLGEIERTLPSLRGVVHAAGTVDDGVLLQQTWPRWREVLRGKAHGARVLDALTEGLPLDFFVLYSAMGWHLGAAGQAAYAAANAELEALAWSRLSRGLPALAVAWGQWPEAGMAASMREAAADGWSARGLGWIAEEQAFASLGELLNDEATVAAIGPVNWTTFLSQLPVGIDREYFRGVARGLPGAPTVTKRPDPAAGEPVVALWRAAPRSEWHALVMQHVVERARHVLGVHEEFVIAPDAALKDAGLDSLMAVELRNVLTRSLGTSLPATLLFDNPSLEALTRYLLRTLELVSGATPSTARTPVGAAAHHVPDSMASMSDADAEALLLAELDALSGEDRQ